MIASRTWFCLYLFEHQCVPLPDLFAHRQIMLCYRLSYGTGRPAILTDDESIWQCRLLLRHPLAIEDDMRLVSMVELMAIRERITNHLSPFSHGPVDERTFEILRSAYAEFKHWYQTWDQAFSQKYEDAGTSLASMYRSPNSPVLFSLLPTESANSTITCRTVPQRYSS